VTTDLIFGTRQLIEKKWKYEKELVIKFTDDKKACIDKIYRL
jgi:hypothetical protein